MAGFLFWLVLAASVAAVCAQELANCTLSSYNWAFNSIGIGPCQVYEQLMQPCGQTWKLPPVTDGRYYLGPNTLGVHSCQCNTVVYSLLSACSACQGATVWQTWKEYSLNCTMITTGSYPQLIPSGVRIPHWAYLDVTNSAFNPNDAKTDDFSAGATAESAAPSPSTTISSSSSTSGSSSSTTSGSSTSSIPISIDSSTSTPAPTSLNVGAIAGGVVGGVIGLALIAALLFYLIRRNQLRMSRTHDGQSVNVMSGSPPPSSWSPTSPQHLMFQKPYDPNDPTTFPPELGGHSARPLNSTYSSHLPQL